MLERVRDAVAKEPRHRCNYRRSEIPADDVAAERQWQTTRTVGPPLAEVDDFLQPLVLIRQLPFVNQQARRHFAASNSVLNTVEWHHYIFDRGIVHAKRQKGSRERARDSNRNTSQ